ncbi:hypothetical protein BOX15_Mlig007578g2, partial [Macrostomum lignano]
GDSQPIKSGPETIETKAIIIAAGIPEENDDDVQEAEQKLVVEAASPQASPSRSVAMATKLPLPQISPVRSATGGSPLPSPSALANYSSSGQSDSGDSSALSQRTVIEVSAQKPTSPQQQQQQPASYDSMFPARRPSQTSGLRQPTAIPKLAPTPPPAQLAQPSNLAAAALNGGEKSLSASALPAPKVLAQKQQQQPPPPPSMAAAPALSASSLPRRLSGAGDETNGTAGGGSGGASRIPPPSAAAPGAVVLPPIASNSANSAPKSRIPAPSMQQQPPAAASSLPQPRSGIPRLAPAAATSVGPQFSLKL